MPIFMETSEQKPSETLMRKKFSKALLISFYTIGWGVFAGAVLISAFRRRDIS